MATPFKKRFWKLSKWFGALFIILFLFRFAFGYLVNDTSHSTGYNEDFFGSVENLRKNYASEKVAMAAPKDAIAPAPAPSAASQKYEKTATIRSRTSNFEQDERAIKNITKKFSAVVQYEQNSGNKGNRVLHLLIGVAPDSFDSFYQAGKKIGSIKATEVTKVDKTNDYRKLNAKKASLETTLASLNELKSKAGQISDFISLHDKILEIESQLQELGVELGDFATENEFCTIRFSLYEGVTEKQVSLFQRTKVALEWTIQYYTLLILSLVGICCIVFLLLVIVDKLNILRNIQKKINE